MEQASQSQTKHAFADRQLSVWYDIFESTPVQVDAYLVSGTRRDRTISPNAPRGRK